MNLTKPKDRSTIAAASLDLYLSKDPPGTSRPQHSKYTKKLLLLCAILALITSSIVVTVRVKLTTSNATGIRKLAAEDNDRVLNVHIVPHTHDDVGWRKTVEQYFYGWNNSIDERGRVNEIISTAMESLLENPARTFTYVEMKFFSMWWANQTDAVKDSVRFLLANGQLVFANGGWCMHDEASTHFMGMIDQTTLGHQFLMEELGVVPTIGWQLDPFGHSATQASLLSASAGFDALFFGRIDYQDLELRRHTQECEGLWQASPLNDPDATIFWGLTGSYGGNYGAPDGFCFDVLCRDPQLVNFNQTQLKEKIDIFLEDLRLQADRTKGNHIMLTMGTDFTYQQAHLNYANLDLLIGTVMNYQSLGMIDIQAIFGPDYDRVNVFYSHPEYYALQKYRQTATGPQQHKSTGTKVTWKTKTDDFFPYADCPHCYWTGYFTSRTAFKRFERVASSFLLAARQIDAFVASNSTLASIQGDSRPLFPLEDAMGVSQHHDSVSGTGMQHVADDYSKRLDAGVDSASSYVSKVLRELMLENPIDDLTNLAPCKLLNESMCEVSEVRCCLITHIFLVLSHSATSFQSATASNSTALYIIAYNSLGTERSSVVRIPVAADSSYRVERIADGHQTTVRSTRQPSLHPKGVSPSVLTFETGPIPPVGAAAFRITLVEDVNHDQLDASQSAEQPNGISTISYWNGVMTVDFDSSTGMIRRVSHGDVDIDVEQSWGYYKSWQTMDDFQTVVNQTGSSDFQNSGAYIFRPSRPEEQLTQLKPLEDGATFVNTSVGTEIHVSFEQPWVKQATRLLTGRPYIEIEYTVGPIPIDDLRGKEIVARYTTSIKSNGVFFTDSNGREFLKRTRNKRPTWALEAYEPVAGNYYPVNAAIYVEDSEAAMSVLVDRSQGGSSLADGSVELMVHRRTLKDDGRGVDEPLNETTGGMTAHPPYGHATRQGEGVVIRGTHRLMIGNGTGGAALARSAMDDVFAEPKVFLGSTLSSKRVSFRHASFTALQRALPPNVMLITLARLRNRSNAFLLRLGHQYGVGEDETMSNPVEIDLGSLLEGYSIIKVEEMTLSGTQSKRAFQDRRLAWTDKLSSNRAKSLDAKVILYPLQVRTFMLETKSI